MATQSESPATAEELAMPLRTLRGLSDRRLISIDLKGLHDLMDRAGYSEEQQEEVRARRRKLQNRNSAKTSAARKRKQYDSMAETNEQLIRELRRVNKKVARLEGDNAVLQLKAREAVAGHAKATRETEIFKREISLLTSLLSNQGDAVPDVGAVPSVGVDAAVDNVDWQFGVDSAMDAVGGPLPASCPQVS
mmetsp:Transcript_9003/g.23180  ORF Transcript_9003/g.23180 Transcript_9003/m.23180 type:complete len:192 (+) Transcript_9003:248-823(+)